MALNAKKMATEIRNALLKGKDVDDSVKKQIDQSWYVICNAIVRHIQVNSEVQINFPAEPNITSTSSTNEGGVVVSSSYSYKSKVQ